jgi:hypothetical protein
MYASPTLQEAEPLYNVSWRQGAGSFLSRVTPEKEDGVAGLANRPG